MEKIKIKYFKDNGDNGLNKISVGDWIDLYTACESNLKKWEFCLIPLGVAMQLPKGYEAHLVMRSSTFKKFKVIQTNAIGIIDNSYCGDNDEWKLPVYAMEDTYIPSDVRICQFRIVKTQPEIEFIPVESLGNYDRGGFGSTDEKKTRILDVNSDGGKFYDMFAYESVTCDSYRVRRFHGVKFLNNFVCLFSHEAAPYTVVLYEDTTCAIYDVFGNLKLKCNLNIYCRISETNFK